MISDGKKIIDIKAISMKITNLRDFMKKYKLKNNPMNERELQTTYNSKI